MTIIPSDVAIHKPNKKLLKLMDKNEKLERSLALYKSDFHDISVVESSIGRFLKYDDTYQAGYIKTQSYCGNLPYINYFLIPYLMNKNIKNILLVGLGSGIIVQQYKKIFKNLECIDIVDIEKNILEIAQKYFKFSLGKTATFTLQDAIIFLKTSKRKYDLIVVDVAGNEGIDERFCDTEYLKLIKKHLRQNGIFISNMPSSFDVFNKKNKFALSLIEKYEKEFKNINIYNGMTSSKIFYKTFFDIDGIVFDITNLILISSDKKYEIDEKLINIKSIGVDLFDYLKDKVE